MPAARIISLALFLLLLRPAVAPGAEDAAAKRARDLARLGVELFARGRYAPAAEAFTEAYESKPHYAMQCNIARCYERLGQFDRAVYHYQRCLEEGGPDSPLAPRARSALRDAEARAASTAQLKPEAAQPAAGHPVGAEAKSPPVPPLPDDKGTVARPFFATLGIGAAVELNNLPGQLKLISALGYHFFGGSTGPALAIEAQLGLEGRFISVETGPKLLWDVLLVRAPSLTLSPSIMVGFAHTSERCAMRSCTAPRDGLTLQLGLEGRVLLRGRALLAVRPITIDLLPLADGGWTLGARYDVTFGAGVVF